MTFAKGASLPDPSGVFNASPEGDTRRAVDMVEAWKWSGVPVCSHDGIDALLSWRYHQRHD